MTIFQGAGFRGKAIAAGLAIAVLCTTATVALAAALHARVGSGQGKRGTMLVGGNGQTLYLFTQDQNGKSACYGSCTQIWHPDYTRDRPVVVQGSGVYSWLLGTTRRRSGAIQVTYNGHPLYFFSGDTSPGDMHGENVDQFGGHWYVVGPGGRAKKPVVFNPGSY